MSSITRRAALVSLGATIALPPLVARAAIQDEDADTLYARLRDPAAVALPVSGGVIRIVFADGAPGLDRARVLRWIRRAAGAMTAYFGHYPVAEHGLVVTAQDGDRVGHATTWGFAGSLTRIGVGRDADDAAFARDWVLVHEMMHVALPNLPRRALWLQEGNATYAEPVARVIAGQLTPAAMWRDTAAGLPRGMAPAAAGGLDGTRDHDRLYWGGALFWLLAEVAILRRSGGRRSLRDAARGINRASGGNRADWLPERMMAAGDAATGGRELATLYARMAAAPAAIDLPGMLAELGVGAGVPLDDHAPLAALRRAITRA